jgi:beta-lactamase regulating signal transducer with metallopeptidase domain
MDALVLLKASALLAGTLIGARMLAASPAVARHRLWSTLFVSLLALPLLAAMLPALTMPMPWVIAVDDAAEGTVFTSAAAGFLTSDGVPQGSPAAGNAPVPLAMLLGGLWIAGAVAALSMLVLALTRLRRLGQQSWPLADKDWIEAAAVTSARLGLARVPRLMLSDAVDTPMAGGVWRPSIFLPRDAAAWSGERRDVVLAHELAHHRHRDPLRHLLARIAVAVYWFHPLAWLAARRAAHAGEQACDELVLSLGVRPSVYAQVLMDFTDTPGRPPHALALPIVNRSQLETRIMSILDLRSGPVARRRIVLPAIAVAMLTLTLAAAQPPKAAAASRQERADDPARLRQDLLTQRERAERLQQEVAALRAELEAIRGREIDMRSKLAEQLERVTAQRDVAASKDLVTSELLRRELELQQKAIAQIHAALEQSARRAVAEQREQIDRQLQSQQFSKQLAAVAAMMRELERAVANRWEPASQTPQPPQEPSFQPRR